MFYQPPTYLVTVAPTSSLVVVSLRSPGYAFGNPSADYYGSPFFITTPFWPLEFAISLPQEGPDAPAYIRSHRYSGIRSKRTLEYMAASWQKAKPVCSLMVPSHRGSG
jgi:hypothetical protein